MLYSCFNFSVCSDIDLPELTPLEQRVGLDPQVTVRVGVVPTFLPGSTSGTHQLQVSDEGALLTVAGTGRYLIRGGEEIIVEPEEGASERNLRLFLLGSAFGVLCQQRGLLLLHANAIVADGAAHAFAGPSGAGKSTLAAHFSRRGYEVLSDDVCAIDFDGDGSPIAWPGLPRLKLWGDALDSFGWERADLDPAIEGWDKYHVPISTRIRGSVPFRRLYLLNWSTMEKGGAITKVTGAGVMGALIDQTYRAKYLKPLGLMQRHFAQCTAVAEAIEVFHASRARGFDVFESEARHLEQHVFRQAHSGEESAWN